jgi:hydrolase, NUDIX family
MKDIYCEVHEGQEFQYAYKYPRASLTADNVVFSFHDKKLYVLLVERAADPYKSHWAFPGGFLNVGEEDLPACARRELEEETHLQVGTLVELGVFSRPDRDPRGPVVTVAYMSFAPMEQVLADDDAADAQWTPIDALPKLAFDHHEILLAALRRLNRLTDLMEAFPNFLDTALPLSDLWSFRSAVANALEAEERREECE